jgi:hypothetical protein
MSCEMNVQPLPKPYFTAEQKTYYSVLFKDGYSAYVTQETLSNVINSRLTSVENIIKYNYDTNLEFHVELMLYSDLIDTASDDYIKTYENLPGMYGTNPLTDFDRKIIKRLNK